MISRVITVYFILCFAFQSINVFGMAIIPRQRLKTIKLIQYEKAFHDNKPSDDHLTILDILHTNSSILNEPGLNQKLKLKNVNRNESKAHYDFLVKPKRSKRAVVVEVLGILDSMCLLLPKDENHFRDHPLRCYQCKSTTNDRDPQCDTRLFKHLRHSEKFNLRKRCLIDNGDFCMKTVKRRHGERITERGCFGAPIIGPDGTELTSKEGCYTYPKEGYLTTTCFCNSDNCNSAREIKSNLKCNLLSVFVVFLFVRLY